MPDCKEMNNNLLECYRQKGKEDGIAIETVATAIAWAVERKYVDATTKSGSTGQLGNGQKSCRKAPVCSQLAEN
jgi:hypothetical protein